MANELKPQPLTGGQPPTGGQPQEAPREPATNGASKPANHAANDHQTAPEHPAASGRGAVVGVIIVLVAIVALAIYGIWKRHHN